MPPSIHLELMSTNPLQPPIRSVISLPSATLTATGRATTAPGSHTSRPPPPRQIHRLKKQYRDHVTAMGFNKHSSTPLVETKFDVAMRYDERKDKMQVLRERMAELPFASTGNEMKINTSATTAAAAAREVGDEQRLSTASTVPGTAAWEVYKERMITDTPNAAAAPEKEKDGENMMWRWGAEMAVELNREWKTDEKVWRTMNGRVYDQYGEWYYDFDGTKSDGRSIEDYRTNVDVARIDPDGVKDSSRWP